MTILFFGDSITWGAWDEEGGWVARVKKVVDEKIISSNFEYYHDIYNLGVSGDTTSELLDRFDFETKQRIDEDEATVIVFAIGVNDSQLVEESGHKTSPDQYKVNLKSLIGKARKWSNKICFIGLFPVDDVKMEEEKEPYRLESVGKFNQILKEVCLEEEIDFIDNYGEFVNKDYRKLLIDGLHPNTEGHKQISEIVLKFLRNKGWLKN